MSKDEYIQSVPESEIIKRLHEGLEDLSESFGDEYHVYYCYLKGAFANDNAQRKPVLADVISEIDGSRQENKGRRTTPEFQK